MRISAVLITFNEEDNILDAIDSVSWADEVIVVDSNSTDRTVELAKSRGAKTMIRDWTGFSDQKQFGVDAAANDWILSLDADERVSSNLKDEILAIDEPLDGYKIPRLSFYMGREIRHSGWYPDHQLRLFDRRKARWNGRIIHESVQLDPGSKAGRLKGDILHYSIRNAAEHHRAIGERYAPLASQYMFDNGIRTSPFRVAIAGPAAFIRSYLLKAGFLDGFAGFCIAWFAAHNAYLKHVILWELQQEN